MAKLITKCNDCKKESTFLIQGLIRVVKNKEKGHRVEHNTYMNCEECFNRNLKAIKDLYNVK